MAKRRLWSLWTGGYRTRRAGAVRPCRCYHAEGGTLSAGELFTSQPPTGHGGWIEARQRCCPPTWCTSSSVISTPWQVAATTLAHRSVAHILLPVGVAQIARQMAELLLLAVPAARGGETDAVSVPSFLLYDCVIYHHIAFLLLSYNASCAVSRI